MLVKLTNETNGLTATFFETADFKRYFGQEKLLINCYDDFVNKNMVFDLLTHAGFFDNPTVTPYSTVGVNEDGVNFKANSFGAKIITWTFRNVFINNNGKYGVSPNNALASLILAKNDVLKVEVVANSGYVFSNTFFVLEDTTLEAGTIALESSNSADEIYWKVEGLEPLVFYFFAQQNPYVIKNLPQILLEEKEYPFKLDVISLVETLPIIKVGGENGGQWTSFKLTNLLTGKYIEYTNANNDDYIIIDSENLTVVNENGNDRFVNATGDVFISLENGNNQFELIVNGDNNYMSAQTELPMDFRVEFDYQRYAVSIE